MINLHAKPVELAQAIIDLTFIELQQFNFPTKDFLCVAYDSVKKNRVGNSKKVSLLFHSNK